MQLQPTAPRAYYPALDILRGLAISIVVFYHNFGSVSISGFGWMGVDLFFVLSGFLITDLLLKTRENKFYFRNFYIRRVLRIFPLYYLVLILFYTLSPVLFSQKGPASVYTYYNENKFWFWSYFQNWLMVHKGPPPVPYLSHFWSLAVEEQFYLFWPVLIFFIKSLDTLKKVIVALITIAIVARVGTWIAYPREVEAFYCNTVTRMDSLLMGCFVAVHLKQGKEIAGWVIRLALVSFGVLVGSSLFLFGNLRQDNLLFPTIGYSLSAAFFTALLYLLVKHEERLFHWLRHMKPLSFIGRISYGIYVYHIPIYLILSTQFTVLLNKWFPSGADTTIFVSLVSVLVTLLASIASFYLVERPILKLKKHFP